MCDLFLFMSPSWILKKEKPKAKSDRLKFEFIYIFSPFEIRIQKENPTPVTQYQL